MRANSFFCASSKGRLSYESLKNAFAQLSPLGQYEKKMRLMMLHSYNDLYGDKQIADIPTEDRKLFEENAVALMWSFILFSPCRSSSDSLMADSVSSMMIMFLSV